MRNLINYYSQFDEWGRLDREPIEFQVNWFYIKKYLPEIGEIIDIGAGPGKYSIELAKEAVNFYEKCGFKITSLGEKYPGIVRFKCILEVC